METDWIKEIDSHNFLAILDVLIDIEAELNIRADEIVIPNLPNPVRFRQLFPADTIPLRDRYLEHRFKAMDFLEKVGLITDREYIEANHRWQSRSLLKLKDETECRELLKLMREDYKRRENPAQEVQKETAKKQETIKVKERPAPKDLSQFLFWMFWGNKLRKIFALIALIGIALFSIWKTLPENTKLEIIDGLKHGAPADSVATQP